MAVPLAGGCLCGAIRYRITMAPKSVVYCHCRMCQRAGGAPVVPWLTVAVRGLVVEQGAPREYQSSVKAVRSFCATCGTSLTFRYLEAPDWIDVTVSSLADPAALPPQFHIWTSSRTPWLKIHDDLPRYAERGPGSTDQAPGTT